jgi:hypothetical protein
MFNISKFIKIIYLKSRSVNINKYINIYKKCYIIHNIILYSIYVHRFGFTLHRHQTLCINKIVN